MQARLARLLARLIATLARLRARLEPASADPDTPPSHWLAHVAARAPHLVQGGRVQATFASPETTAPVPAPSIPLPAARGNAAATRPAAAWPSAQPAGATGLGPPPPLGPRSMRAPASFGAPRTSAMAPGALTAASPPPQPTLDIELGVGPVAWPRLDAARTTAMPFPAAAELSPAAAEPFAAAAAPFAETAAAAWPELPAWPEPRADAATDLDPLFESELRRLERSLREMEGLPWIG